MTYSVKEAFFTLQGEGAQAGRAAVFLRFAGCNLWSGLERDRVNAVCNFCDTDFIGVDGVGGGKFNQASALAGHVRDIWDAAIARGDHAKPYVVCTGGEPLLQLDAQLIEQLHIHDFEIAIETNGTLPAPEGVDWICVSPKSTAPLKQMSGHELKLVYPQTDAPPERFEGLDFNWFFLQPMDGPNLEAATRKATAFCMAHPKWRLSLQTHKLIGIP